METRTKILNPVSLNYMKIVRVFLKSVDLWPSGVQYNEPQKFHAIQKLLLTEAVLVIFGQCYFILKNFRTLPFLLKGDVCISLFLTIMGTYRVFMPCLKQYRVLISKFIQEFHLIHFVHKSQHFSKMYHLLNILSYYFSLLTIGMMCIGMILFNVTPMYNNYKSGVLTGTALPNTTKQFSVYYQYPGFDQREYFIFVTCFNYWLSYVCTVCVCVNDLLLTLIIFQIIGHIEILKTSLKRFPQPTTMYEINIRGISTHVSLFNAEENKEIHSKIIECVNHHRLIVSFTKDVSDFFGPLLGFTYLYHLISCCLLLLECSKGESAALARYGPLTIIIFGELVQISVIFEVVGTKSETIMDAVYSIPWECMDVSNQRCVRILLNRVQKRINVTAMGITTVGVQTMLKIIKTTISYFTFLRTIDD